MNTQDLYKLCEKHGTMDVHTARACEEFGGTPTTVTKEQRQRAKQLNYLVIYGVEKRPPIGGTVKS